MQYFYSKKECFHFISPTFLGLYFKHFFVALIFFFAAQLYAFQPAVVSQEVPITNTGPSHDKYVVGYYAQWAIYARDFNVSDIEAEHLTHLMYAFYDTIFDEATETSLLASLDDYADFGHTEDPGITHSSDLAGNMGALIFYGLLFLALENLLARHKPSLLMIPQNPSRQYFHQL